MTGPIPGHREVREMAADVTNKKQPGEQPLRADGSQPGRRVLVAVVTGEVGARIQAWRERHDPEQARRLPPHTTLCYWAPVVEPDLLERQVRHAFDRPVAVRLGSVHEFGNQDHTFYLEVLDTA